jgi:hypothetical protein
MMSPALWGTRGRISELFTVNSASKNGVMTARMRRHNLWSMLTRLAIKKMVAD